MTADARYKLCVSDKLDGHCGLFPRYTLFDFQSELEEENPVMNYICPTCTSTFSSLDFALLLDRDTGLMRCDQCGTEVLEQFGTDGQTGNADDRKKRQEVV